MLTALIVLTSLLVMLLAAATVALRRKAQASGDAGAALGILANWAKRATLWAAIPWAAAVLARVIR